MKSMKYIVKSNFMRYIENNDIVYPINNLDKCRCKWITSYYI